MRFLQVAGPRASVARSSGLVLQSNVHIDAVFASQLIFVPRDAEAFAP